MSQGLSVNDAVSVSVSLSPIAAALRNFGNLMLVGSSNVIDTNTRMIFYTSSTAVAADFGTNSPEYLAASLFFSQSPQPGGLYIGRWAQSNTAALMHGGVLSTAQQAITNFNSISNGAITVVIDGTSRVLTGISLTGVTNLNGVAAAISTALGAYGSCAWNAVYNRFDLFGVQTGTGTQATGTITLPSQPAVSDVVTVNGVAITFVASGATGNQVNLGSNVNATAVNLLNFLQASVNASLTVMSYALNTVTNVITVTSVAYGLTGNAYTLAKTSTTITVSGATLTGGTQGGTLSYPTAPGAGTDLSPLLNFYAASGALPPVQGINAESLLTCVTNLTAKSTDWYGLNVCSPAAVVADHLAVAGFIQSASPSRIYGVTSQDSTILNASTTTDIASQLSALGYSRTFVQYSSSSPYAAISIYGKAFTVNFLASQTTLTVKFQTEPGVVAETLTESQAAAATAKNCNIFVNYNNGTAIVQQGVMSSGTFFDVVHGTDWLQNDIQTSIYNLLYTQGTKIPQTDSGMAIVGCTIEQCLTQAVANGLCAPGTWNAAGFGALSQGGYLEKGFYVYIPPMSTQQQSVRAQRIAPTAQVAVKLAGAVHFASVIVNVNS